jgi:hypothetical protein
VEKEWAALDLEAQKKAYWAIYGTRKQADFFSTKMDPNCRAGPWPEGTQDWAELCVK